MELEKKFWECNELYSQVVIFSKSWYMLFRLVSFLILFSAVACKKNKQEDDFIYISGSGLVGKWVASERFISPGAGGTWNVLPRDKWFTIEFKADSSFTYSANFPKADSGFSRYSVTGIRIFVTSLVNSRSDTWTYELNPEDKLELAIFPCIEGCPYGLRRIR